MNKPTRTENLIDALKEVEARARGEKTDGREYAVETKKQKAIELLKSWVDENPNFDIVTDWEELQKLLNSQSQMNEQKAREILKPAQWKDEDGVYSGNVGYLNIEFNSGYLEIFGCYEINLEESIQTLKAIVWWMENKR